ncbi:TonB-dependent receptor [Gloeocapsa sp. PCC 7428]|uniref:TonB-dependent receptor domain-containing protein n=1 Tax=Gloeocapsa sp. PCC 7428 TaxID=1173026 RepID=UPI0002A5DF2B|nr:TonB-dependent receptor [Gloeocapsa sp. PCC 7428]AFZ28690.1 TonB-dependent receptor [Gloeocapsa sp. PCC 7428]
MEQRSHFLVAIASIVSVISTQSIHAEELSTLQQNASTVTEWLAQSQVVQVTKVELNPTSVGLQVILHTVGEIPTSIISVVDNTLIADIPNAVLVLPDTEQFQATNPTSGITSVSVTNLGDRIRLAIAGQTTPPVAEVSTTDRELIFSVTPEAGTAEEPIEIVVTATRTAEAVQNVPRSVTIINRDQIEQQTTLRRDLQDILAQTVPGLGDVSPDGNTFSQQLRGRRVQILIDGVPIKSNLSTVQARDYRSIAPDAIERIEIVRGPTAIYGDGGTGGVINIITRQASEEQFTSTAEIGIDAAAGEGSFLTGDSFSNYLEYGFSGNEGIVDFVFNISRNNVGSFFDAQGDRIPFESIADTEIFNVFGKVGVNLNSQQRLQVSINHYNESENSTVRPDESILDIPGIQKAQGITVPDVEFIGVPGRGNRNTVASLNYTNDAFFGSQLQGQLYYRSNSRRSDAFDFRDFGDPIQQQVFDKEQWGARLQMQTPVSQAVSLLWGADYSNENIQLDFNFGDAAEFDNTQGRVFRRVGGISIPYDFSNLGLFAQLQWDLSDRWLISGGARYERFNLSVDDFQTPFVPYRNITGGDLSFDDLALNLGTLYRVTNAVSLFANFAQGFSAPDFGRLLQGPPDELTSIEDDINVTQPQKVDNYEIGVRGEWKNVQLSLAGFYNESELGTRLIPGAALAEIVRVPERIYGVEATIDWQPGGNWQLGSTITWQEGEFEEDDEFLAITSERISPLKLTAYVEHETLPGWNNRLQLLLIGDRTRAFTDGTEEVPISGYITLDYIGSIQLGAGTLNIGIENLLNEQYFPVASQYLGGFYEPDNIAARGRTLRVGYRIAW